MGDSLATDFARAEDTGTFAVEDALVDQVGDPISGLERGVELDEGIRPQEALVEALPYLVFDAGIFDTDETSYVRPVVFDETVA